MVQVMKHEWYQVDAQYLAEIDEDLLSEIYPDLDEDEIAAKMADLESGEITVDEVINDAWEEGVEIEWDSHYEDWWTSRKGGYEVTYDIVED
jgi:hypothetical protein